MKTYLLRNIPLDLYRRIQHEAIDRGITVGALLLLAVSAFLADNGK